MMKVASDVLINSRKRMHETVKDLSQEQWFAQPEGFANNVAWNVGHLVIAQQGLIYRRAGLEMYIPSEMMGLYMPGTSPANWESLPDTNELLRLLVELPDKMAADIEAGMFDNVTVPEESGSIEHVMVGNNHHEGLHMGAILALLDFVKS